MPGTDRLLGSWRLHSCSRETPDGRVADMLGPHPKGLLTYADEGVMSVHLVATDGIDRQDMEPYCAYYGTYSIDPDTDIVRHHVEAASMPGLMGTTQERCFRLDDDRLILSAAFSDARTTVIWKRRQ